MESKTNTRSRDVHVAVFPYFAFGHINPFIHVSNKLASHGVRISFLSAPGNIPRISAALTSSPSVSIVPLTFPHVDGLPIGVESTSEISPATAELLKVALDGMQPQIRSLLSNLRPDAVFFDFAQSWLPSMTSELGIKTVMFSVFSLISNSYLMGIPSRVLSNELPPVEELKLAPPGYPNPSLSLKIFQAKDLLYAYTRFNGKPSALQRNHVSTQGCDALAFKSCHEMEGPYWEFFQKVIGKPVLMAGIPLPETNTDRLDHNWATWLARFPPKSVVFCSFGSETFLSESQVNELALGLELTELPFLMVLSSNGFDQEKLDRALPKGFMERVKERGCIHIGWVPQHKIMAHGSVGCYISHAGFESVMEAIVSDCQLVLLPFKGDQFLNSKLLSLDMKVGVEVHRRDEDGYFGKDDILEAVNMVTVDAAKEPGYSIGANLSKWKELLMNKEFEDKYVFELVNQLLTLVAT